MKKIRNKALLYCILSLRVLLFSSLKQGQVTQSDMDFRRLLKETSLDGQHPLIEAKVWDRKVLIPLRA